MALIKDRNAPQILVADKHDLLAAATDHIIGGVLTEVAPGSKPRDAIRSHALGVPTQLPGHDDREQFLAGIDLILAGIETVR